MQQKHSPLILARPNLRREVPLYTTVEPENLMDYCTVEGDGSKVAGCSAFEALKRSLDEVRRARWEVHAHAAGRTRVQAAWRFLFTLLARASVLDAAMALGPPCCAAPLHLPTAHTCPAACPPPLPCLGRRTTPTAPP